MRPGQQQQQQQQQAGHPMKRRFSTFFKSLVIELDKEIYGPDNHLVEVYCRFTHRES